jgi:GR25 family glycosyltransferase involved in LPS biosynthesis
LKIYLINLDSRLDRLEWALSQAARFDINFERISALKSSDVSANLVTPGVMACFESHRKAWEKIANSEDDYALVLEDDFSFKRFNICKLKSTVETSESDFLQIGFLKTGIRDHIDLVLTNVKHILLLWIKYLSKCFRIDKLLTRTLILEVDLGFPDLVPSNIRAGAHAYIISKKMATEIIQLNNPVFLAADDFLIALARMRVFVMRRFILSRCSQFLSPTSIPDRFRFLV